MSETHLRDLPKDIWSSVMNFLFIRDVSKVQQLDSGFQTMVRDYVSVHELKWNGDDEAYGIYNANKAFNWMLLHNACCSSIHATGVTDDSLTLPPLIHQRGFQSLTTCIVDLHQQQNNNNLFSWTCDLVTRSTNLKRLVVVGASAAQGETVLMLCGNQQSMEEVTLGYQQQTTLPLLNSLANCPSLRMLTLFNVLVGLQVAMSFPANTDIVVTVDGYVNTEAYTYLSNFFGENFTESN